MRIIVYCFIAILLSNCSVAQNKPSYISFKLKKDSIFVYVTNSYGCPTNLKIKRKENNKITLIDVEPYQKKQALVFFHKEKDSLKILQEYKFTLSYGNTSPLKKYDTLFDYSLPFLKGKRYKILQGQNTNFTHKGPLSKYAIDLKMKVGQTICAMRTGIVVAVKEDSNKGGNSQKYKSDGNYIMLYHKDGLFTQYVHLKKNGAIVKKGDTVQKGQPIGYSGNTGYSTEPHLHFGVYKPTKNGFVSIPYILDAIPTKKYTKGKFAANN